MERTHVSINSAIPDIRDRTQDNIDGMNGDLTMKPLGFWYSINGGWQDWCGSEMQQRLSGHHLFTVEIAATASILTLASIQDVSDFAQEFELPLFPGSWRAMGINWAAVAKRYDGIEVVEYQWAFRFSPYIWYYAWDCTSGCIWRPNGNVSVSYLKQFDTIEDN